MSFGIHPYGSKIGYSIDGVAAYADLANLKDLDPPGMEISSVKITSLQSANRFHEYTFGMGEGGTVSLDFYWNKAQYSLFLSFFFVFQFWKILYPLVGAEVNNSNTVFTGFVSKLDTDNMVVDGDDAIMCPVEMKVSGKPVFVQGS